MTPKRVCEKLLAPFLFRPVRARTWGIPCTQGGASLALGYVLAPFQGFNQASHTRSKTQNVLTAGCERKRTRVTG